ncbi:hypothetical protein HMI54_015499 [Coelomomyces lativittatus]|nr:hypothetical protein HMI54_015499 [Coelomomyces lativittatus]
MSNYPQNFNNQVSYEEFVNNRFNVSRKRTNNVFGCIPLRLMGLISTIICIKLCLTSLGIGIYTLFVTSLTRLGYSLIFGNVLFILGFVPGVFGILLKSYKLAFFGPLNVLLIMLWNVGIITTLIVFVTTLAEFIPIQDAPLFSNFGKVFLIIAIVFHFLSFVFEIVFIYVLIAIYQNLKRKALRLNQESVNYT